MYKNILAKNINTNEVYENQRIDSLLFKTIEKKKLYYNDLSKEFDLLEIDETDINYINKKKEKLKEDKIKEIKQEASRRILNNYPQYKQNNVIAAIIQIQNKELLAFKQNSIYELNEEDINHLKESKECKDYISLIRIKSNELEILIQSKKAINTIEAIKVSDDNYWI